MKIVYRMTLRALQGCTQSLRDLAFPSLPVPNYTTLCRRAKTLDVELPILRDNEPDSSGWALLHKSNVRTPWHRMGIIRAIQTDWGRARSAMRLMTPTRTATSVACAAM
ncbi:MAG: hypothetical protein E5299_01951 [Burkholderia gladioli]|nr:MAG: hypothetical protein E5299_01951 [Burkholderia gladioli]